MADPGSFDGGRKGEQRKRRGRQDGPALDRVQVSFGPHGGGFSWISPDGLWRCIGFVDVVEGHAVVKGLQLEPASKTPPGGITSSTMRAIPIGRFQSEVRANLMKIPDWFARGELPDGTPLFDEEIRQRMKAAADAVRSSDLRRGRPSLPDEHFENVAHMYLEQQRKGTRRILLRLGEALGVERDTARDWVHRARVLGFLTPGQPGRGGAEPGPRLTAKKRGKGKP